ncbi:MAG: hypothetical protein AB7E32_08665 [Desulfovibrio sp.]
MPVSKLQRSIRIAWLLGLAGVSIWMPVLTWTVLAAGDATGGIVGTGWYGACLGMAWYLSPWRNPGVPLWKLLGICLGAVLLGAIFFIVRYELYQEATRQFVWSMAALAAMFLPAFLVGKKTWRDFFPD